MPSLLLLFYKFKKTEKIPYTNNSNIYTGAFLLISITPNALLIRLFPLQKERLTSQKYHDNRRDHRVRVMVRLILFLALALTLL